MKADQRSSQKDNEAVYEELISVIEASQGTLALLIVVSDDPTLRESIIQRYEQELQHTSQPHRLLLVKAEPSLRAVLGDWAEQQIQPSPSAVLTVTGIENLLWFKLKEDNSKTEVEKFFGYLQWGREGLRDFPYPIVLWITQRILKNMSSKSPDFWSWRTGVFRFVPDAIAYSSSPSQEQLPLQRQLDFDSFLLPLEDLQALIAATEQREGTKAPLLETLYSRLAQVYQRRIENGDAKNLQGERDLAIKNYQKALALQTLSGQDSDRIKTLLNLGRFYFNRGSFQEAGSICQQSLQVSQKIEDMQGIADSYNNLGNVCVSLNQYSRAAEYYNQALVIQRRIGNRNGEAISLMGLGITANRLNQYLLAIEFFEQSLAIQQETDNHNDEACSWFNLGIALVKAGQVSDASGAYRNARQLYVDMDLEVNVQLCDTAIMQIAN
jgi:tetratricopeptide (TPR) repeat protein